MTTPNPSPTPQQHVFEDSPLDKRAERMAMPSKTLAVYQATYDTIQQAPVIYQQTQNLPKKPSIKARIHHTVTLNLQEQKKRE